MNIKNLLTISLISLPMICSIAEGDFYSEEAPTAVKKAEVAPAAAPSLDPRLPPVIPGQEMDAGGGRRVIITSTAGPVPVATLTPQPAPNVNQDILGGAGIIVDTRNSDKN
jgi:hypothetical protein